MGGAPSLSSCMSRRPSLWVRFNRMARNGLVRVCKALCATESTGTNDWFLHRLEWLNARDFEREEAALHT